MPDGGIASRPCLGKLELPLRVMVHALVTDALYSRYGETVLALYTYPRPRRSLPRHC